MSRLQAIKNRRKNYRPDVLPIWYEDMDWLIEQAERLHGTKHKVGYIDLYADCNRMVGSDSMKIAALEEQNKRYKQTLEFYGDEENHKRYVNSFEDSGLTESEIMKDKGRKARQELEG